MLHANVCQSLSSMKSNYQSLIGYPRDPDPSKRALPEFQTAHRCCQSESSPKASSDESGEGPWPEAPMGQSIKAGTGKEEQGSSMLNGYPIDMLKKITVLLESS
jgi:hypothetical protein